MWTRPFAIVNPRAGRRAKDAAWLMAETEGRVWETEHAGHARELAQRAADEGADALLVWGGDGSLNECLDAAVERGLALAPLPGGTGNDFSRHLGLPQDAQAALKAIKTGRRIEVDCPRANGRRFLNVVSCGFDAVVGKDVNRPGRMLKGSAAYNSSLVKCLISYRAVPAVIELDGEKLERRIMLCAVGNASSYGGGMRIAPDADLQDGLLDVVIMDEVSKFELLRQFPTVFKGGHTGHPAVTVRRVKKVRVQAEGLPWLGDGEDMGYTPLEAEITGETVSIWAPAL